MYKQNTTLNTMINITTSTSTSKNTNKSSNRCNLEECNKKLQLTDFKCKCNNTYCSKHRLPETHCCNYDYKTNGRDLLNKQNQPCIAKKILII